MIRDTLQNIIENKDIRTNLIKLKSELKEDKITKNYNKEALLYLLNGEFKILEQLLEHTDAKVRKHTAGILEQLARQEFLLPLFKAYQTEQTRFVRTAYLLAIRELDYRELELELKQCLEERKKEPITEENKKHIMEEIHLLHELLLNIKGNKKHTFTGWKKASELVLITNRNHKHITIDELGDIPKKELNAGILVKTNKIKEIFKIRTVQEVLFKIPEMKAVDSDPIKAAKQIIDGGICRFLEERHQQAAPFYFRVELKSKAGLEERSKFSKRFAIELEHVSKGTLINSTSNYEVELRLIETKNKTYQTLIKLYTINEERFYYRKNTIASSIRPYLAALTMQLAKEYLTENAQVLDPFCGTGTMLIERANYLPVKTMYGIDSFGEAIKKARENTKAANLTIHYINRDFFDFKHEYLFDEVISNLPFISKNKENDELKSLYQKFFLKISSHMKHNGILVLYTHNKELLKSCIRKSTNYKIEKEYEISMKEGTYIFIIRIITI